MEKKIRCLIVVLFCLVPFKSKSTKNDLNNALTITFTFFISNVLILILKILNIDIGLYFLIGGVVTISFTMDMITKKFFTLKKNLLYERFIYSLNEDVYRRRRLQGLMFLFGNLLFFFYQAI